MEKKLFKQMNWPEIETICYSEHQRPHEILGPHILGNHTLIQCFIPSATQVIVELLDNKKTETQFFPMVQVDEHGFFAVMLPLKKIGLYYLNYKIGDKSIRILDPYQFFPTMQKKEIQRFHEGVHTEAHELLGAKEITCNHVKGVRFRLYTKEAMRVSVVGEFNQFDGRIHPMTKIEDSHIYEIFIPELKAGTTYLFELKLKSGLVYLKGDPYARAIKIQELPVCVVENDVVYGWTDQDFMKQRAINQTVEQPISVLELYLPSFWKDDYQTYRDVAKDLIAYVKETGYTHVEFLPLMETFQTHTYGYETIGYFSINSRYGNSDDLKYLMNELHVAGIYVIFDWVAGFFPEDNWGLSAFDGSHLYEQHDIRNMYHGTLHTLLFQYKSNEVCNFLISSALFFLKEFHVDGLRIGELGGILYLNYGKGDGAYQPNIYGGPENLEGIDFLRRLNQIIKKQVPGVITIAEDTTDWPEVTGGSKNSLGFTYKWNESFRQDIMHYLSFDPYFRSYHHNELTQSMTYHYSERFILNFSHEMSIYAEKSMLEYFPGSEAERKANWRLAIGYMFSHPGKKHMYQMNQITSKQFISYLNAWNYLYCSKKALYTSDYIIEGFEWINEMNQDQCTISFFRKSESGEVLLFIANFANVLYERYEIGVEQEGKYKELLNSDHELFGGENRINKRVLMSKKNPKDGRNYSIKLRLAPLSCTILEYQKEVSYEMVESIV